MGILERNFTIILLILIIGYILCCIYTKNNKDQYKLTEHDKTMLYLTTIYGYILGIFITSYKVCILSESHHNNINVRIIELIILLISIGIILYAYTFRELNHNWSKVSESLWPLLTAFVLISTLSINSIYVYFNQ